MFRFKHVPIGATFRLYGRVYRRVSARKYVPVIGEEKPLPMKTGKQFTITR